MKRLTGLVARFSRIMDGIAALGIVAVMLLVVSNILLRTVFKQPILGTYEYVGFITAVVIGLALAACALQNGHIAVGFVVERLSCRFQAIIDSITNALALGFWGFSAWYIGQYANSLIDNGVVSPTTQTPFYPFVFLVSFGLVALCLVLTVKLIESVKKAAVGK